MLNWAVGQELIAANPMAGLANPDVRSAAQRSRDRVLDTDEIRRFWAATGQIGYPHGDLMRMLLLVGQRRGEVSGMTWFEIDLADAVWTIPAGRSKNGRAHIVHLSDAAMEIVLGLPRMGSFLFSFDGMRPVAGFQRAVTELRQLMHPTRHFVLHDLRRCVASSMAELGVGHHVVDRVLNHSGGAISGVARVYNRYEYLSERKNALELWGRHIKGLVDLFTASKPGCKVLARPSRKKDVDNA
jgi:integrase